MQMNRRMSRFDWLQLVGMQQSSKTKKTVKKTGRKLDTFKVMVDNQQKKIKAYTKSEARAKLKAMMGVDKLPVGTKLVKVKSRNG